MSLKKKSPKKNLSEEQLEALKEQRIIRICRWIGIGILLISIYLFVKYYRDKASIDDFKLQLYIAVFLLVLGVLFIMPIHYYIFDVKDWKENKSIRAVIKKLRLRAIVFNNLSILILGVAIFVIVFSFYLLLHPNTILIDGKKAGDIPDVLKYLVLVSQIGAVVVLIFLVQILFRVFKYVIRVAGFYNGKADALELNYLDNGKRYDVKDLMQSMTPQAYDISDVESTNLLPPKIT